MRKNIQVWRQNVLESIRGSESNNSSSAWEGGVVFYSKISKINFKTTCKTIFRSVYDDSLNDLKNSIFLSDVSILAVSYPKPKTMTQWSLGLLLYNYYRSSSLTLLGKQVLIVVRITFIIIKEIAFIFGFLGTQIVLAYANFHSEIW